ncbi:MAG: hypothetical protein KR126chlam6_00475 [Candidatus Anoxychlamydiales bacterium]|nr:hypothetical protein [Candidatus Anoxychlamydiales bacterium]
MQKLVGRDTYTPMDAPLVRSNCDLPLNREETLSVSDLKIPSTAPKWISLAAGGFKSIKGSIFLTGQLIPSLKERVFLP